MVKSCMLLSANSDNHRDDDNEVTERLEVERTPKIA